MSESTDAQAGLADLHAAAIETWLACMNGSGHVDTPIQALARAMLRVTEAQGRDSAVHDGQGTGA